jgi:glycosyltransferase involved in cell wall biosynthesis
VGYWAWELPVAPPAWRRYMQVVSEMWTPSRFVADSLGPLFDGPVRVVPHTVASQPMRARRPSRPFTVLTMADSRSSFARKNPAAAVRAFERAFGHGNDVRLVLKLNGRAHEMASLAADLALPPNVTVVTDFLDEAGLDALFRSADVLLSLHRAEGFGLPMLEAMARGVPVVGTGWSGNTEFMTQENSLLVPYRLVPVDDPAGIYHGGRWAEPDVDAAVDLLRELRDDAEHHQRLARAAHTSVALSGSTTAAAVATDLASDRRTTPSGRSEEFPS